MKVDIIGRRFGQLVVIGEAQRKGSYDYWPCQCDCGKIVTVRTSSLTSGKTRSCGCIRNNQSRDRMIAANHTAQGNRVGQMARMKPNANNTTGYRGVSWHAGNQKYVARIIINGKRHHLGYYDDPIDASRAYNIAKDKVRTKTQSR